MTAARRSRPGTSAAHPRFFARPAEWRGWLARHHLGATEVWVGFRKRATGQSSITWPESVDEALCHGWIDGLRKRLDDESYVIRFTPRRAGSTWSAVNIRRFHELEAEGRITPAGAAAWRRRRTDRSAIYSYEQRRAARLPPAWRAELKAEARAWEFWNSQPPSYRSSCAHWVTSAKREETRRRRMESLLADCAAGRRVKPLRRTGDPA